MGARLINRELGEFIHISERNCVEKRPTIVKGKLTLKGVRLFTDGDSSNFNKPQGDAADPGSAGIVREDDTPIIHGWFFFYKLTESNNSITHCVFVTNLIHLQITQMYIQTT